LKEYLGRGGSRRGREDREQRVITGVAGWKDGELGAREIGEKKGWHEESLQNDCSLY